MIWKFTVSFLLIVFATFNSGTGQQLLSVKKSEFVDNVPERKAAYAKIKEAHAYYEKGLGYVQNSINLFGQAHNSNKTNPELNYNIGVCYLIDGPRNEALPYLLAAISSNPDISEDIHFLIGLAYQYQNDFSRAISHFKINLESVGQDEKKDKTDLMLLCEKHILECKFGKEFLKNPSGFVVEHIKGSINSRFDEFNPFVVDGYLYFSSRKGADGVDLRSYDDQKFFEKIYKSRSEKDGWRRPQIEKCNSGSKSNSALFKGPNGQFVVYNSNSGSGDLFMAEKDKEKWKIKEGLRFLNAPKSRESSASFTESGNEVYFVSNRKGGHGECDIYFSKKDTQGKWSDPVNVGSEINTEYDEGDVFVTANGTELYFSSMGHNSMGGYDIFRSKRSKDGKWGAPQNMGVPINSTDNDITFSKDADGRFYFASSRDEGLGGYDLYAQKIIEEKPQVDTTKKITPTKVTIVPVAIPVKKVIKENLVYKVQIAACRREMKPEDLFKRYKGKDVIEHVFVERWHRYTIGAFSTYDEAAKYKDACGVSDAFVVLFKGPKRIGFAKKPTRKK